MSKVAEHIKSFVQSFTTGNESAARESLRHALDVRQAEVIQSEREAIRTFDVETKENN